MRWCRFIFFPKDKSEKNKEKPPFPKCFKIFIVAFGKDLGYISFLKSQGLLVSWVYLKEKTKKHKTLLHRFIVSEFKLPGMLEPEVPISINSGVESWGQKVCYFPLFDGDKGGGAEFRYVSHPILWSCWRKRPSQWHNVVAKNLQHEDLSIPITLSLWSLAIAVSASEVDESMPS